MVLVLEYEQVVVEMEMSGEGRVKRRQRGQRWRPQFQMRSSRKFLLTGQKNPYYPCYSHWFHGVQATDVTLGADQLPPLLLVVVCCG